MIKFPPWLSLAIRLYMTVSGIVITAVQGAPEHFGGKEMATDITFWLGFSLLIIGGIFSSGGTGATPSLSLLGKVQ